ncbi:hypothetical protein [Clostridium sp.]|uniref:hypothetical protein n=1 Tax=Clostridium sp. TaxID=1506 RepID=UPI002842D715|nr:hypothetical protein [Clostridium sp.]MDR3595775.1 hypothetical protein [Clostridium sp.]
MGGRKRKKIESDRKINMKNKNLMIDKILSYNLKLLEGIEIYKDANRNFILLIFLGALLINFPLISVPCCILSMFYLIKMLQFIRYNSINNIVKELAKDLSFKGIYDKEKVEDMLCDFKVKYGKDINEYTELADMLEKYEAFVTRIEYLLKNINKKEKSSCCKNNISNDEGILFSNVKNDDTSDRLIRNHFISRKVYNSYKDINEKVSVFYKKEDGQIKIVNKAIEFFDNEGNDSYNNENAVILKNINEENKNLTVYLYKKSSDLQKNAL